MALAPLRERSGDIALLLRHFLSLSAAKYGRPMNKITPRAITPLEAFDWPGNIRQMENLISQIVITNKGEELTLEMLPGPVRQAMPVGGPVVLPTGAVSQRRLPTIEQMERHLILEALEQTQGAVAQAAKLLELSPATLYRKIKKFGGAWAARGATLMTKEKG